MKVLFLELVPNVGHKWDIKEVSDSYARNFLIPKNLAKKLTEEEEKNIINKNRKKEEQRRSLVENRHKIYEELNWKNIDFELKKMENWKTFGWIWEKDIILWVEKFFKIHLEKKHIQMPNWHIKHIWKHDVFIKLSSDTIVKLIINVK